MPLKIKTGKHTTRKWNLALLYTTKDSWSSNIMLQSSTINRVASISRATRSDAERHDWSGIHEMAPLSWWDPLEYSQFLFSLVIPSLKLHSITITLDFSDVIMCQKSPTYSWRGPWKKEPFNRKAALWNNARSDLQPNLRADVLLSVWHHHPTSMYIIVLRWPIF